MGVSRKAEPAATAEVFTIPRAWFFALAALVVIPWLIASAIYFSSRESAAAANGGTPAAAPAVADRGPWGHLEMTPILVSPPLEYVAADWGRQRNDPDQWRFPGVTRDQLGAFLTMAGFTPDQAARVVAGAREDPSNGGLVVAPDAALVRSLTPEIRGRLYTQLAKTPLNFDQANSFRFFGGSPEDWLTGSLISPATRALIEPLIYRDGDYLHFSDIELARAEIADPGELRRLAKTLLRQTTMIVRLSVREAAEVPGLAEYWGRGGRRTDLRPLLESVAAGNGPGHSIDVVHLLPSFARNHLYRYPKLTAEDLNRSALTNCLWTSLNFFNVEPDDRFLDLNASLETLKRDYFIVESGFQLGDVIAFLDEDGDLFHVAVYLADDLVFSKNGTSPMSPWVIMPLERVKGFYRSRSTSPRLLYHRHGKL